MWRRQLLIQKWTCWRYEKGHWKDISGSAQSSIEVLAKGKEEVIISFYKFNTVIGGKDL